MIDTDDATDLFRELLETIKDRELEVVRLALAMAFAVTVRKSADLNMPAAIDQFTHIATSFYYKHGKTT